MDITGYALVIGGGGGIGAACALTLAIEGAAGVLVADLDLERAKGVADDCITAATALNPSSKSESGFRSEATYIDITSEESVKSVMDKAVELFGRIDYCVNCAGIGVKDTTDMTDLSTAEFRHFLDVNATGMFIVMREVVRVMRGQSPLPTASSASASPSSNRPGHRGAIVNLCSASSKVAVRGVLPYTASKHAAVGLSKNAALDNAHLGIRVNAVCPSWVDTPILRAAEGVDGLVQFIESVVPMGRIAEVAEVADAVVFLCSPRASYITGAELMVDGGTTLTASR